MPTTEMSADAMEAARSAIPPGRPILMVNLLRYNDRADYPDDAGADPCSGREAYFTRYVPAFAELTRDTGIKPFWVGNVLAPVVAPAHEAWDDVAIVEYPSFEALWSIISHPEYQTEAAPHQHAALADWRFIATTKLNLPV